MYSSNLPCAIQLRIGCPSRCLTSSRRRPWCRFPIRSGFRYRIANWLDILYHGPPENLLTPQLSTQSAYLAFLGRICAEKRVDLAIEIAPRASLPLKIAAKVEKAGEGYFRKVIQPLLSQRRSDIKVLESQ